MDKIRFHLNLQSLTEEERIKIIKKTFIERQFRHMRMVQDNMFLLEQNLDKLPFKLESFELINRCIYHDLDKLSINLVKKFYDIFEYKRKEDENLDISKFNVDNLFDCTKIHYSTQSHHYDYHAQNNVPFSNIDLCEMVCDTFAINEEFFNNDINELFLYYENSILVNCPLLNEYRKVIYYLINLLNFLKRTE